MLNSTLRDQLTLLFYVIVFLKMTSKSPKNDKIQLLYKLLTNNKFTNFIIQQARLRNLMGLIWSPGHSLNTPGLNRTQNH